MKLKLTLPGCVHTQLYNPIKMLISKCNQSESKSISLISVLAVQGNHEVAFKGLTDFMLILIKSSDLEMSKKSSDLDMTSPIKSINHLARHVKVT